MLTNYTKNVNITANSTINDDIALGLRATINEDGTFNISKNIRNTSVYFANKEACDGDYNEFETQVCELAKAGTV